MISVGNKINSIPNQPPVVVLEPVLIVPQPDKTQPRLFILKTRKTKKFNSTAETQHQRTNE